MKKDISKTEAQKKIAELFSRASFSREEVKKIKRLAMKHKIKLAGHRKQFCRKCLSQLKGRLSVTKNHKTIVCGSCGFRNKFLLK